MLQKDHEKRPTIKDILFALNGEIVSKNEEEERVLGNLFNF